MALSSDAGGLRGKRTAIRAVKLAVILLVVGPFLVHAVPQVIGASHSYVVLSDSMAPTIAAGDVVVVESVDPTTISEGDVITFREGTDTAVPTTHRVVEVVRAEGTLAFRTKGDANEDPDQTAVAARQVLGEVIFVIPYLGYVIQFANTTYGFMALVIAPVGLLILTEVWGTVKTTRLNGPSTDELPTSDATDGVQPQLPAGSGNPARADSPDDGINEPDEPDGYTVAVTDLRLTAVILGLFAAYSGWVTYTNLTMWSVMVSVAATGGFLLVAGLVLFARQARAGEDAHETVHPNGRATEKVLTIATPPPGTSEIRPAASEPVGFLEILIEQAIAEGHPVFRDPDGPAYCLITDDVVFHYPVGEPSELSTAKAAFTSGTAAVGNPDIPNGGHQPTGGQEPSE